MNFFFSKFSKKPKKQADRSSSVTPVNGSEAQQTEIGYSWRMSSEFLAFSHACPVPLNTASVSHHEVSAATEIPGNQKLTSHAALNTRPHFFPLLLALISWKENILNVVISGKQARLWEQKLHPPAVICEGQAVHWGAALRPRMRQMRLGLKCESCKTTAGEAKNQNVEQM